MLGRVVLNVLAYLSAAVIVLGPAAAAGYLTR